MLIKAGSWKRISKDRRYLLILLEAVRQELRREANTKIKEAV